MKERKPSAGTTKFQRPELALLTSLAWTLDTEAGTIATCTFLLSLTLTPFLFPSFSCPPHPHSKHLAD